MNKVYKIIWNASLQIWMVTGELSKGKSKSSTATPAIKPMQAAVSASTAKELDLNTIPSVISRMSKVISGGLGLAAITLGSINLATADILIDGDNSEGELTLITAPNNHTQTVDFTDNNSTA